MRLMQVFAVGMVMVCSVIATDKVRPAEVVYAKKCSMCHLDDKPKNDQERNSMVAPPMRTAMASVVITIDAVDGPMDEETLKESSVEFLKDYLYNPTPQKTNCESFVIKKFGRMPSLKGFISDQELNVVVPWVYDNFKPVKINGKYKKQN
ncbi:MAG: hypothetical protein IE909_02775 [Campylobacterales bacterium]|nr:hypothetical protein [Campylobacterales bacterium]